MQMWELAVRESVRQTLADYTAATDRFDLSALAACFGPEGVLQFTGEPDALTGPEAIASGLAAAMSGRREAGRPGPTFVRHHVSSVRFISVAVDRVETSCYFAVHTDIGLDHWGRYRDVLMPAGERWLFASRRVSVDAFSGNSLMAQ
ncbi:nuclear transport factor 2 family protein [Mycobacterium sp. 236(2023)]|uniref:nuclear transport factor 2 family protein n=1 Tax=Mycobacterium sp. 236(2023) TaxID=3038163 RepID=UPI002414E49F|nr:nuclear transport factor 2 family protein [Mycobacterium sp. 236(2023)]MDG4669256.1 nuclear transport factor 2 family protein [Mycobacterium sp. 236(2023)]